MMYNFFLFIIIMCTWSLVEQTTRWFVATEQIFWREILLWWWRQRRFRLNERMIQTSLLSSRYTKAYTRQWDDFSTMFCDGKWSPYYFFICIPLRWNFIQSTSNFVLHQMSHTTFRLANTKNKMQSVSIEIFQWRMTKWVWCIQHIVLLSTKTDSRKMSIVL